jgi:hypothetical protein
MATPRLEDLLAGLGPTAPPPVTADDRLASLLEGLAPPKKEPTVMGRLGETAERGVDQVQSMFGGAVEAVGELTGSDTLTGYGKDVRVSNEKEARDLGYAPTKQFTDIRGIGDVGSWLLDNVGEQIPTMAPTIAGGIAGGLVGGPIGALIGAYIPSATLGTGEVQANIKERGGTAPGYALLGGAAIGAFDSLLPGKLGTAVSRWLGKEAAEKVLTNTLKKEVAEGVLKRGAKGFRTEFLTEALQEAIGEYAAATGTDTDISSDLGWNMLNAGAVGGVMGGGMSMITPGPREAPRTDTDNAMLQPGATGAPVDNSMLQPGDTESPIYSAAADVLRAGRAAQEELLSGVASGVEAPVIGGSGGPTVTTAPPDVTLEPEDDPNIREAAEDAVRSAAVSAGVTLTPEQVSRAAEDSVGNRRPLEDLVLDYAGVDDVAAKYNIPLTKDERTEVMTRAITDPRPIVDILSDYKEERAAQPLPEEQRAEAVEAARAGKLTPEQAVAVSKKGDGRVTQRDAVNFFVEAGKTREEAAAIVKAAKGVARTGGDKGAWLYDLHALSIDHEASAVEAAPTDAQKDAGNYKKGHVNIHGLDISLENQKGGERSGVDPDGKPWKVKLPAHYGYIRRTEGADGDQVDVYVGHNPASEKVFVIDQVDVGTKAFDEHKVMLGTNSRNAARRLYIAGFSDGKGKARIGNITGMTVPEFKEWLKGDTTTPIAPDLLSTPARAKVPLAREAAGLAEFVSRLGGMTDPGGEVAAADGHRWHLDKKFRSKLLRPDGMDPDKAREAAAEAGYIPEGEGVPEFLAALAEDLRTKGGVRTVEGDEAFYAREQAAREADDDQLRADTLAEVRAAAKGFNVDLTDAEVTSLGEELVQGKTDAETLVSDYAERRAMQEPAAPATTPTAAVPTWQEFVAVLPKDENNNPDIAGTAAPAMARVSGEGVMSWKGLTDAQKIEAIELVKSEMVLTTEAREAPRDAERDRTELKARSTGKKTSAKEQKAPGGMFGDTSAPLLEEGTSAFKKWWKNSQAQDEDGNPVRLYHVTTADVESFKPGGLRGESGVPMSSEDMAFEDSGRAIWLSPNPDAPAAHNVGGRGGVYKEGANTMPVYASIQRPLVLDDPSSIGWAREVFGPEVPFRITDEARAQIIAEGYDGILWKWGTPEAEVVVFEPEQVKSTLNKGTYNPNDRRVQFQRGDSNVIEFPIREEQGREGLAPGPAVIDTSSGMAYQDNLKTGAVDFYWRYEGEWEPAATLTQRRDGKWNLKYEGQIAADGATPEVLNTKAEAIGNMDDLLNEWTQSNSYVDQALDGLSEQQAAQRLPDAGWYAENNLSADMRKYHQAMWDQAAPGATLSLPIGDRGVISVRKPGSNYQRPPVPKQPTEPMTAQLAPDLRAANLHVNTAERRLVQDQLDALVARIAGPDAKVMVHDKMTGRDPATGKWDKVTGAHAADGTLHVSLESLSRMGTGRHELIHFLKATGAIDKRQWRALERRADEWVRRFKIKQKYEGLTREEMREEAIAEAYGAYGDGALEAKGFVKQAFQKIMDAIEQIRAVLSSDPYLTARQVFADIEAGGARREATGGLTAREAAFARGETQDPAFKRWFGNSKVVDENGEPLIVYHGSRVPYLDRFDLGKEGTGAVMSGAAERYGGVWFSSSRDGASFFADPRESDFAEADATTYGEPGDFYAAVHSEKGDDLFQIGPFSTEDQAQQEGDRAVTSYNADPNRGDAVFNVYLSLQNPLMLDGVIPRGPEFDLAKRNGHDGIIARNVADGGAFGDVYVAFEPNQIKSVNNRGTWNPADDRIAYARGDVRSAEPFYSAVERAVQELPQEKGSAAQMRAMISKTPGVKAEEMQWTGLDDYLAGKTNVTRKELVDYMAANKVVIEETTLGADLEFRTNDEYTAAIEEAERAGDWDRVDTLTREQETLGGVSPDGGPKFASWTLPGGTNYREVLMRLPEKPPAPFPKQAELDAATEDMRTARDARPRGNTNEQIEEAIDRITALRAERARWEEANRATPFTDGHYEQPNVLAHMRLSDRVGPNGEKILHSDEFQSDWHQKGRKSGYAQDYATVDMVAKINTSASQPYYEVRTASGQFIANIIDVQVKDGNEGAAVAAARQIALQRGAPGAVPDAPFKKTWHELAFRRLVRMAAEQGYDAVTWTKGAEQAERYDLINQVDTLEYKKNDDGTYVLGAIPPMETDPIKLGDRVKESEIANYVGEDVAKKIIEGASADVRTLSGLDLKVGGEGMVAFYDKMIPAYANKFGRKFGARVGEMAINKTPTPADPLGQVPFDPDLSPQGIAVHSLPITPEMRNSVLTEGVSQFQRVSTPYTRATRADQSRYDKIKRSAWLGAKRAFAAGGNLPGVVFDAKIQKDSALNVAEMETNLHISNLEQAMGVAFKDMTKAEQDMFDQAIRGANIPGMKTEVAKALSAMRMYIDGLSVEYSKLVGDDILELQRRGASADVLAAKVDLLNTLLHNNGSYIHRSYRVHDDPNWGNKIPEKVFNDAFAYLQAEGLSPAQAENTIDLLLRENTAADSFEGYIKESTLGAKDLSVLKKRKDIAAPIRALLGEYTDPRLNFARTVAKMSRLIYNTQFLRTVKAQGENVFLFSEANRPLGSVKIAAEGSKIMEPLNGMYAPPEIAQAFKDALGKDEMGQMMRAVIRANGMIKYGKTVLSPTTAARNFMSGFFFTTHSGHFNYKHMSKAMEGFRAYMKTHGGGTAYQRKLVGLGVIYDNPFAGEMMKLLEDSKLEDTLLAQTAVGGKVRGALNLATRVYQYGDDFWKIIGFENEVHGLAKARHGITDSSTPAQVAAARAAVEAEAAERIRNTYPTYSMVGRTMRKLRKFPLAGTFVSFPSEIIRTQYHGFRYLQQDWNDPQMRPMAIKRAVGLLVTTAALSSLAAVSKSLMGVDDDEDEAIRLAGAPWSANSTLLYTGRDDKGRPQTIDLSYLDPYAYFMKPITALIRAQPVDEALAQSIKGLVEPFLGEDIGARAIREVVSNKKESGGRVFNPVDTPMSQMQDIGNHVRTALQPGVMSTAERFYMAATGTRSKSGREYKVGEELAGAIGFRVATFDPLMSIKYRMFEFTDKLRDGSAILNSVLKDQGSVSREDIAEALEDAREARTDAYNDFRRVVAAAVKVDGSKEAVYRVLKANKLNSKLARALIEGRDMPAWHPAKTAVTGEIKSRRAVREPEAAATLRERFRMAREEARQ